MPLFKIRHDRLHKKKNKELSTKSNNEKKNKVGVKEKMGNVESTLVCLGRTEELKQNLLSENADYGAFVQTDCIFNYNKLKHHQQPPKKDSDCTLPTLSSQVSLASIERTTRQPQTHQDLKRLELVVAGQIDEELGGTSDSFPINICSQHEQIRHTNDKEYETSPERGIAERTILAGDAEFTVSPLPRIPSNQVGRGLRHGGIRVFDKASRVIASLLGCLEDILFPKTAFSSTINKQASSLKVRGGVMLHGCSTPEEHYESIKRLVCAARDLHGQKGLKAFGLEYRMVLCEQHKVSEEMKDDRSACPMFEELMPIGNDHGSQADDLVYHAPISHEGTPGLDFNGVKVKGFISRVSSRLEFASQISNADYEETSVTNLSEIYNFDNHIPVPISDLSNYYNTLCRCHECMRRLFHVPTNTLIVETNRKQYIADGDMYEVAARLAQENAFDVMIEEGDLQWITVEDTETRPIQALINSDHPVLLSSEDRQNSVLKNRPTLIICTGRGKVRAGVFSRQHLLCDGMEVSTCIPHIREAQARNMNVLIMDPNVIGEAHGYTTFQKTINYWCQLCNQSGEDNVCRSTYILSHSASGGHLVRYLLDEQPKIRFLPYVQAIVFTDSTHNVQWAMSPEQKALSDLIQSKRCVYFRCGKLMRDKVIDDQWYLHPAGQEVQTDDFWRHRFGTIKTMWAGTDEHSLTNWYPLTKIWEHFDSRLLSEEMHKGEP